MKKHLFALSLLSVAILASCSIAEGSSSSSLFSSSSSSTESSSSTAASSSSSSSSSLSSSSSSSSSSSIDSSLPFYTLRINPYYSSVDFDLTGEALRKSLESCLQAHKTRTCNYSENNTILQKTDKSTKTGETKLMSFYSKTLIGPSWDSGATWNKEHVWPDSRGVARNGPGADPHMIRAAAVKDNSSRGNMFFGDGTGSTYDPGSLGHPEFRGNAARIIFYTATMWGTKNGLTLSDNASDSASKKTMGRKSDLLKWNLEYGIDLLETQRNEYIYNSVNKVRNPFIDEPTLATAIWGN